MVFRTGNKVPPPTLSILSLRWMVKSFPGKSSQSPISGLSQVLVTASRSIPVTRVWSSLVLLARLLALRYRHSILWHTIYHKIYENCQNDKYLYFNAGKTLHVLLERGDQRWKGSQITVLKSKFKQILPSFNSLSCRLLQHWHSPSCKEMMNFSYCQLLLQKYLYLKINVIKNIEIWQWVKMINQFYFKWAPTLKYIIRFLGENSWFVQI
jgi:hypothetical protein